MARRKQQESRSGNRAGAERTYTLADALSATQQHTVPIFAAEETASSRQPTARGSANGAGTSYARATHAPRPTTTYTNAHPTLADTASAASTIKGKTSRRTTHQPAYPADAPADLPTRRQSALFATPETIGEPVFSPRADQAGILDEVFDDGYDDGARGSEGDSRALMPGRPTIALPTLADTQLPAVRDEDENRELAAYQEPSAPTVFIHGARKAPRPYVHVVPRRVGRRPFVVQFITAMVTVMALLTVVTLATPLGQSVAFANTFQSYANAVRWVPTPTPTPRPKPAYSPPKGANPGQQAVINEIVAVFGGYSQGALAVSKCESGYDPNAWNSYPIGNSHAEGVFQILYPSTWDTTSYAADSPYNYVDNIHAAYQIFSRDGYSWREWECKP